MCQNIETFNFEGEKLSQGGIPSQHQHRDQYRYPAMLSCHNCMRRCLQTIIGDSAALSSPLKTSLATRRNSTTRRQLNLQRTFQRQLPVPGSSASTSDSTVSPLSERTNRRQQWLESRGVRPTDKPKKDSDDKSNAIRRNLKFLKDPLQLAEHVRKSLRDDNFDITLETVRAASKDVQCTVSWNHLIDWQLSKGRMNAAIHTYNEVFEYCLIWLFQMLKSHLDEKKVPNTRCSYIYYYIQWLCPPSRAR
jgi:hypothetical protein